MKNANQSKRQQLIDDMENFDALQIVIDLLNAAKGKERALTNTMIRYKIKQHHTNVYNIWFAPAEVRKMINTIRTKDLCDGFICAGQRGYWCAMDAVEAHKYLERFKKRVKNQEKTIAALGNKYVKLFHAIKIT